MEAGSQAPQEAGPPERQTSCRGQTLLEHRLHRLGILLAELGHGVPISLDSDLSHDTQARNPNLGNPIGTFKDYDEILDDLPSQLRRAIGFCFNNATERRWVERGVDATERVSEFLSNVVGPVNEYYEQVRDHAKKISFDVEFMCLGHNDLRQDRTFKQL